MTAPTPIRSGMPRFYCTTCQVLKCRHGNAIMCHGCNSRVVIQDDEPQ